jgi:hypothetical protein
MTICAAAAQAQPTERALERHVRTMQKSTNVVRFFEGHRWLLADPVVGPRARMLLRSHRANVRRLTQRVANLRVRLAERREARRLQAIERAGPRTAICHVFGRYCGQALRVARCESNFRLHARNGQYRGLFQMGSSERHRFGHGTSAFAQATAAHRYFVLSGRDWSPWSCKPW